MPTHKFKLNGKEVSVDAEDDVHVLWVIRDLLGVTGPKYGCGINVCKACTSHINGKAFNPCSVRICDIQESDEITTIEGLADTWNGDDLHPMQQAWVDHDVPQCGYCQPGQIMAAVAKVRQCQREGRNVDDDAIEELRNICRCGTYNRIRPAIKAGAKNVMSDPEMISRKELLMRNCLAVSFAAAVAALLVGAGTAQAKDNTGHDQDTQSPAQGVSAGAATVNQAGRSFGSEDGDNRPDGANGTESKLFQPDSRYLEGPLGGLVKNGPLK